MARKDNRPLVSIIVPVYNSGRFLVEAINSILNQSYDNLEIVVVNDGSTDNSWKILNKEYSTNTKIKLFSQRNQGQSAACNFGFRRSVGEYIKFFDSDDILNVSFIENQIQLIQGKDSEVASASWGRFYNDDVGTFKLSPEPVWKDMRPIDWIVETIENNCNMMQCALWLIPRRLLDKSGLWNEDLSLNNDFDFIIRVLLASSKIYFSEKSVLYYRSGISSSLSKQTSKKAWESGVNSNLLGTESILCFENSERTRRICGQNLCYWLFQTYYRHPDLGLLVEGKIRELKFTKIIYGARPVTRRLSNLFGWKFILWIKFKFNFLL